MRYFGFTRRLASATAHVFLRAFLKAVFEHSVWYSIAMYTCPPAPCAHRVHIVTVYVVTVS